jgi:dethiobiotin synthetase
MSPVLAAEKWGKKLEIEPIAEKFESEKRKGNTLIIEGAGGLLSPLNDDLFQADLIKKLNVPVILVGEDRTGMVNSVLLTLRCARDWDLDIMGVVLMNSRAGLGNAPAIDRFGKGTKVVLEVPPMSDKRSLVAHLAGSAELRKILGVSQIPS